MGVDYRLFGSLAWIWPIISPPEDYVEETDLFSKIIIENSKIDVKSLLHLGCGGGHNDYTFKKHFNVTGVDISEDMLRLAGKLNPDVRYKYGDMRSVNLNEKFDAVAVLDSINYMTTKDDLGSVFNTAYNHLEPGGILLTIQECIPGNIKQNSTEITIHSRDDVEITFIENSYEPDTNDPIVEETLVFLIRIGGKLEIYTDRHICGIFKLENWLELLNDTGFEVKQKKFELSTFKEGEYYPMLICSKPM